MGGPNDKNKNAQNKKQPPPAANIPQQQMAGPGVKGDVRLNRSVTHFVGAKKREQWQALVRRQTKQR